MESKTNYTLVGVIVLVLTVSLLSSLLWLSVGFDSKQYRHYIVYIKESVHGLSDDSPVKFNGVKVGMVSAIALDKNNPQAIKLLLKIEKEIQITTGTRATLITQGITGSTFLGLRAISSSTEPLKRTGNEPYPVIPYNMSFFGQIENSFSSIGDSLQHVFDPENTRHIKESLASLQHILKTIEKNDAHINQTLEMLPKVVQELKTSIRDFGSMANHVSSTSGRVSKTMEATKEGIDQFSQQTLPNATALIRRLDVIAANVEDVSNLMRQNPAVIIRGTVPQHPGPGE